LYAYLYQEHEGRFSILHALDGYDEISLTGDFKMISNEGEKLYSPESIGLPIIKAESITGGATVEASARIFEQILMGQGSKEQNAVVLANAAAALTTADKNLTFEQALEKAAVSLNSGKALAVFKALVNPKTKISIAN
jgi:anthranilate phosphoribosyltransferase